MEIRICNDKKQWNERLLKQAESEFLQSWEWGEFQESVGNRVLRLQGDRWQGQGVVHRLWPGMRYLYLPRFQISDFRFQNVIDFLKKQNYVFLRIEPVVKLSEVRSPCLAGGQAKSEVHNRQPRHTLILDISKTEEELLAQMHPKTRYNIGLAEKKGVEIKEEKNIEIFWKLNQETVKRGKFKSHNKNYYAKMLEMDICRQLTACQNGRALASNLLIILNNTCTYLHGASSFSDKNLMAPYLLQWEGIKLAKKMNCRYYDFWGIAPIVEKGDNTVCFHNFCWDANHKWAGVTRFKVGFGGKVKEYQGAVDVILNKNKYFVYKLARKILNIKY